MVADDSAETIESQFIVEGAESIDPLGLWQTKPVAAAVSYTVGTPRAPADEMVWKVQLPYELNESRAVLQSRRTLLASRRQTMRAARHALEEKEAVDRHVSADNDGSLHHLELELHRLARKDPDRTTPETSFGLGDWRSRQKTQEMLHRVVQKLSSLVAPSMRVETHRGSRSIAMTQVRLSGEILTVSNERATEPEARLHRDSVSLAMGTRLAHFELLGHVVSGALVLAAKLSVPGGALLALPAVWNYMQGALDLAQRIKNP